MEFTSDISVELVQHVGGDSGIAAAARVSTSLAQNGYAEAQDLGILNYLMKHRHGSPFEHNSMTFVVSAPLFVFREWHRHRVGWSYNETSARYAKLEPKFYTFPADRPLVQAGSSAHPNLVPSAPALTKMTNGSMVASYTKAWSTYEALLADGVANEVARSVLPVGIYSSMYATCNARSLMSFLSLRVYSEDATFESKPQFEIQVAAEKMEAIFARYFPVTHEAFVKNGRVSP